MTTLRFNLPVFVVILVAAYLVSSDPLRLEDLELPEGATYQLLQHQRLPDCPPETQSTKPPRPPGSGNGGSANGGGGGSGAPRPNEEKLTNTIYVNGLCCRTVSHTAPVGFEFMLVISQISNIEPQGSMAFYDLTKGENETFIMIVKTEEGIQSETSPPLMERSETNIVIGLFCGGTAGKSTFKYSLTAVPAII